MTIETNISDLTYGSPFPPPFQVGDVLVGKLPGHLAVVVTGMDVKETEHYKAKYFGYVHTEDFTGSFSDLRKIDAGIWRPR